MSENTKCIYVSEALNELIVSFLLLYDLLYLDGERRELLVEGTDRYDAGKGFVLALEENHLLRREPGEGSFSGAKVSSVSTAAKQII